MPSFPLHPRPFAQLHVSPDQRVEYEATAMAVLRETLDEYHHFVLKQQRKINKKRWKAVKMRENVTVYKKKDRDDISELLASGDGEYTSRRPFSSFATSSRTSRLASASVILAKPLPKLLGVGTIAGSLEEVLHGSISPDNDSFKLKKAYMDDELVDGEVLHTFTSPSLDDPFLYLGIQWLVKAHPPTVNAVVLPRDTVYLKATGLYTDPVSGERIGYQVMHSIEPPECPPLRSLGIQRGSFSSCFLFKQMGSGTVELYMKAFMDPAGSVPDAIAVLSAATGLISTWKSVWCSQNKKLAWLLNDAVAQRTRQGDDGSAKVKTNAKNRQCCAQCMHAFGMFRRSVVCELCRAVVCSKCRTVRKLTHIHRDHAEQATHAFCDSCITMANNASAAEIARHEYVYDKAGTGRGPAHSTATTASIEYTMARASNADSMDESGKKLLMLTEEDMVDDVVEGIAVEYEGESMRRVEMGTPVTVYPLSSEQQQQQRQYELWLQMNQRRMHAEETYEMARPAAKIIRQGMQARPY